MSAAVPPPLAPQNPPTQAFEVVESGHLKINLPDGASKLFVVKVHGRQVKDPEEIRKVAKLLTKHFEEQALQTAVQKGGANVKVVVSGGKATVSGGGKAQVVDHRSIVTTRQGALNEAKAISAHLDASIAKIHTRYEMREKVSKALASCLEQGKYNSADVRTAIEKILYEPSGEFATALENSNPSLEKSPRTLGEILRAEVGKEGAYQAVMKLQREYKQDSPNEKSTADACEAELRKILAQELGVVAQRPRQADTAKAADAKALVTTFVRDGLGIKNASFSSTLELEGHISSLHLDADKKALLQGQIQSLEEAEPKDLLQLYALKRLQALWNAREADKNHLRTGKW